MRLLDDLPRMLFSLGALNGGGMSPPASLARAHSLVIFRFLTPPPPHPAPSRSFVFLRPQSPFSCFFCSFFLNLSLCAQQGSAAHQFNIDLAMLHLSGLSILLLWVQRSLMSLLNNGFVLVLLRGTKLNPPIKNDNALFKSLDI